MKKHLWFRCGTLMLCSTLMFMGITPERTGSNSALASTDEEQANQVCVQGGAAVVTVKTSLKNGYAFGSGFLVSQDGLIITNAHVVADSPSVVTVMFRDGQQVPADVVGFAKGGIDLAALKIPNLNNLPALSLANSGAAKVGYRVFAIGSPLDPDNRDTCTQGDISRIRTGGIIQHTAILNQGNSGESALKYSRKSYWCQYLGG